MKFAAVRLLYCLRAAGCFAERTSVRRNESLMPIQLFGS